MAKIDRQRVERVARIYASNRDASQALEIVIQSFSRLCRQYGIETPYARNRRKRRTTSVSLHHDRQYSAKGTT